MEPKQYGQIVRSGKPWEQGIFSTVVGFSPSGPGCFSTGSKTDLSSPSETRSDVSNAASRRSREAMYRKRSKRERPRVARVDRITVAAGILSVALSGITSNRRSTPSPVKTSTHPSLRDRPTTRPGTRPTNRGASFFGSARAITNRWLSRCVNAPGKGWPERTDQLADRYGTI